MLHFALIISIFFFGFTFFFASLVFCLCLPTASSNEPHKCRAINHLWHAALALCLWLSAFFCYAFTLYFLLTLFVCFALLWFACSALLLLRSATASLISQLISGWRRKRIFDISPGRRPGPVWRFHCCFCGPP